MSSAVFSLDTSLDPLDSTYEDFLEFDEDKNSQAADSLSCEPLLDALGYHAPDNSERHNLPGITEIAVTRDAKPKRCLFILIS